uniref:Uncharacterized protein n=1 Tax=Oryza meridionalis TaxID=40149 RepID=A0A0E0DLQ4_9ORYZ
MGFMAHLPAPLFFPASSWSGARTTVGAGGEGVARAAAAGGWPAGRRNQDVDRTLISCMQELAGEKGLSGDSLTFSALAIGTVKSG